MPEVPLDTSAPLTLPFARPNAAGPADHTTERDLKAACPHIYTHCTVSADRYPMQVYLRRNNESRATRTLEIGHG